MVYVQKNNDNNNDNCEDLCLMSTFCCAVLLLRITVSGGCFVGKFILQYIFSLPRGIDSISLSVF